MSLLFIDGFDHYDPQQKNAEGEPLLANGKAAYLNPGATRVPGRRPSSFALRLPQGDGGGYVKNVDAGKAALLVGCAIRVPPYNNGQQIGSSVYTEEPTLVGVRDTTGQIVHVVTLGADSRLKLVQGNSYGRVLSNAVSTAAHRVWHYVELLVTQSATAGILQVRLNGVLAIELSGQNTLQGGGPLLTAFAGAVPGQKAPAPLEIDDFYVCDTTGTSNNTFLGDVRVDLLKPNRAGSVSAWTPTPAGAEAWQVLGDDSDATLLTSTAAGQRVAVGVTPLPAITTPAIAGLQVSALARKTDAGPASLRLLGTSNAKSTLGPAAVLQTQAAWHTALIERDPNTDAAWTEAGLNAAEFGIEST